MSQWNELDFFIFLIFFLNLILGMSRGATKEIISMMCLCVALIFTIKFAIPITDYINSSLLIQPVLTAKIIQNFIAAIGAGPLTSTMLSEIAYSLSIVICFAGVFCACEAVLVIVGFMEVFSFPYATLNRKIGAGLGFLRGYVIALIFILILLHIFSTNPITGSYFVNLFRQSALRLDRLILGQDVDKYQDVFRDRNLYHESDVYKILPMHPNQ
jgi:uncharacterized membrane protein required for colicin V production